MRFNFCACARPMLPATVLPAQACRMPPAKLTTITQHSPPTLLACLYVKYQSHCRQHDSKPTAWLQDMLMCGRSQSVQQQCSMAPNRKRFDQELSKPKALMKLLLMCARPCNPHQHSRCLVHACPAEPAAVSCCFDRLRQHSSLVGLECLADN